MSDEIRPRKKMSAADLLEARDEPRVAAPAEPARPQVGVNIRFYTPGERATRRAARQAARAALGPKATTAEVKAHVEAQKTRAEAATARHSSLPPPSSAAPESEPVRSVKRPRKT